MYKNEFWHKACFLLLVLSVKNSNCNTYHIPNSQLKKFKLLQNTHSCDMWVQLQITKYCIINISAQLLLSKHRHSKKPTGTKSQQVTSQGYLQSKDIDRILIIYFFLRSTCRREIQNDTNLSCQTTEER